MPCLVLGYLLAFSPGVLCTTQFRAAPSHRLIASLEGLRLDRSLGINNVGYVGTDAHFIR